MGCWWVELVGYGLVSLWGGWFGYWLVGGYRGVVGGGVVVVVALLMVVPRL